MAVGDMVDRWTNGIRRFPAAFTIPKYLKWVLFPLAMPFTTPLIYGVERHRIFWRPVILFHHDNEPIGFFYLYVDNLFLGSCWGLLTGYTRGLYFKPPPQSLQFLVKNKLLFAGLLATRVIRRTVGASLFFEAVERQAELFFGDSDLSNSTQITASNFFGIAALASVFKVSNIRRDNAIITGCILGGYLVGSKIAQWLHGPVTPRIRRDDDD